MAGNVLEKVKSLPQHPGVYIFRNSRGNVIYVGKAKSLKNRVSSYFNRNLELGSKTRALVSRIEDLSTILTFSEIEALILEAELIKKYKPRYNIALKDDKSYLYIVFRNEKLPTKDGFTNIPKILTARKTDLNPKDKNFGPYPNSGSAKYILTRMRRVFPYRDCSESKFKHYHKLDRPCLYGYLGLCQGPCTSSTNIEEYKKDLKRLQKFLAGGSSKIISDYEKLMENASKNQDYEEAGKYRDILKRFEYIRNTSTAADKYIENPNLIEDTAYKSLEEIKNALPFLTGLPKRIECYDISNISGKEAVGSMVVAINGQIAKSEYRKFRIRLKDAPDDFSMMQEVLRRRLIREFSHDEEVVKWGMPDLIVLDGGKGQVSSVLDVMVDLNVAVPLVGLAKRYETIVYENGSEANYPGNQKSGGKKVNGRFVELKLPKNNTGLQLLIRLRNEAHRFAQSYHHYLRLKKFHV